MANRRPHTERGPERTSRCPVDAHRLFIAVLIGNVIGGTALFALIAYAQVMQEI